MTPRTVTHQALCPWGFSRQGYWSGLPCPSPGDILDPGIEPRSPALQADSLPSEPPGKPKNTGVGSLSLLQEIFPIQESNQGLLHCRWILHQLNYQGSPNQAVRNILIKTRNIPRWKEGGQGAVWTPLMGLWNAAATLNLGLKSTPGHRISNKGQVTS